MAKKIREDIKCLNCGKIFNLSNKHSRKQRKERKFCNLKCRKEFQECWALENLQPLEKLENMKKGNKF